MHAGRQTSSSSLTLLDERARSSHHAEGGGDSHGPLSQHPQDRGRTRPAAWQKPCVTHSVSTTMAPSSCRCRPPHLLVAGTSATLASTPSLLPHDQRTQLPPRLLVWQGWAGRWKDCTPSPPASRIKATLIDT